MSTLPDKNKNKQWQPGDRLAVLVHKVDWWDHNPGLLNPGIGMIRPETGVGYWTVVPEDEIVPEGIVVIECTDRFLDSGTLQRIWQIINPETG